MDLAGFTNVGGLLQSGVYALVYKGKVVYVGKAKQLLTRVYTHRQVWSAKRRGRKAPKWIPTKGILFDDAWIMPCPLDQLDAVEREMVNLYKPRLNELLKTQDKITAPIRLQIGDRSVTLNDPATITPMPRRV